MYLVWTGVGTTLQTVICVGHDESGHYNLGIARRKVCKFACTGLRYTCGEICETTDITVKN